MIDVELRIGRFTSSEIWKLTTKDRSGKGFGDPAKTYIEEKRAERCLGRSVDTGASTQEMVWGKVMEWYLFENELGLEYSLCSKETVKHPIYPFWTGSPDFQKAKTAGESKCYYPKKFYTLSKNLIKLNEGLISLEQFRDNTKDKLHEIFWQVVSNAILLAKQNAEIIAFTPTEKQLVDIRVQIEETNVLERLGIEVWQGRFIYEKKLFELPYIPEHSNWPNMVKHEFALPEKDVEFLTKCVIDAENVLSEI